MTTAVRPAPVRGSSAPAGQRLASTVRLPWLVGLGSLLTVAAVIALLSGRSTSQAGVQHAALDALEATAVGSAQQVRRSLNEGSDDLAQIARAVADDLEGGDGPADGVRADRALTALRATTDWHFRYLALGLADARTGRFVLEVPGEQAAAPLGELPDDRRLVRVLDDGRLVETVPVVDGRGLVVAAVYDPAFLYPNLFPRPKALYVVDDQQRAVAAPGAVGLTQPLPTAPLRRAAEDAGEITGTRAQLVGPGLASVIAHAPVEGVGPAGEAGLGVVVVDDVPSTGGGVGYRVGGVLAALLLAVVAGALFWWLHRAVVRPVLGLQRSAERVGYGDLSRPVAVTRYDEVGTTARALERLRLALIRAQVQDVGARDDDRGRRDG